ncbi:MAG TPA: hypothetical protein VLH38_03340 [Patescibacteria group bacterium]|nr:hypothetical protein [Patescibacteria group bacterium]
MIGKSHYRAEIRRSGRVAHKLFGRYNTKEVLDAWLAENWHGPLTWESVPEGVPILELTVWRYWGTSLDRVIINAQMVEK